ncbi:hypothetical protein EPUS_08529 [Endocarpon pusillum Z07020]|uniref:Myb-like domain-containing protein n=1 Tax=Endocarpon pusillum (strain Z07020 / HMAS-L-300199) TaxID=1263415 RepID=U1GRI2_ENDPU|nr:uncharacterized protein EPUS_08529 [Endocarpon pusillum Z07020]ERF74988.1 hypothetical protein EPUS_08529 [Endocarpon pusillum Z07020]
MDLKRVGGLQNLLDALDVAKHKHWSQHGVSEHYRTNNDTSQTPQGTTRHFRSATTGSRSGSTGCSASRATEQQVAPYVAPLSFTADHHNRPAHLSATQPSAQVKMGGFSEMDSKSLIAAALAPDPGVPDPGKKVKKGYSNGPITPNSNVTRQKSTVPSSSGKRRRRASSVSSQTSHHEDNLPVSKKSHTREKDASIGEKLVTGLEGSTNHQKTAGTTHKNSRPGGSGRYDNNEIQAHSVSTKQCEETKKPAKPVSSYVVSSQGHAELEANPKLVVGTEPPQRKVRSAYGYNQDLGQDVNHQVVDRDNHEFNDEHTETQLPNPPQSLSTRPANKKPRLITNADPFTPSPPGTPSASSLQHEPDTDNNNNDDDDDDGDDEYTNTPPSRRKKTGTNKSTATKSKSKARIASAKNRKQNFPVASAISEASEADKMMFRMKGEGKSWKEITAEWTRMTGRKPGFSTLSVRFGKLQEKFARMGDMDFHRLLKFKSQLETAFNRREKWDRIATMIVEDGGAVYTGQALRVKYRNLVEVGLHREDGAMGDGGVEFAGVEIAEEGEGEAGGEVASFDEWDRELMGDGNAEIGDEIGDDDDEGAMMLKMSRRKRGRRRRGRRVELPRYHDDLEGEFDEDDENFMDGELFGGGGGGGGGGEDMSE